MVREHRARVPEWGYAASSGNDGDRVLILTAAGELILARLGRDGYREQSRVKVLDVPVWAHPAFADRHLFVRGDGAERPDSAAAYELVCYALVE
jgi:hypothetical protein